MIYDNLQQYLKNSRCKPMFADVVDPSGKLGEDQLDRLLDLYIGFESERYSLSNLSHVYAQSDFLDYLGNFLHTEGHAGKANRLVVAPGGQFAVGLSDQLAEKGFETVGFLDNFLSPNDPSGEEVPLLPPARIGELVYGRILVATPNFLVQHGLRDQLMQAGAHGPIHLVGEIAFTKLFEADMGNGHIRGADQRRVRYEDLRIPDAPLKVVMAHQLTLDTLMALWDLTLEGEPVWLITGRQVRHNVDIQIALEEIVQNRLPLGIYFCDSLAQFIRVGHVLRTDMVFIPDLDFHSELYDIIGTLWNDKTLRAFPTKSTTVKNESSPIPYQPVDDWVEAIRKLRSANPGRPAVMFVGNALWHNHVKMMYALKKRGVVVILFLGGERFCNALPIQPAMGRDFCDLCILSGQYATEVEDMVSRADVDLVHALCHVCFDPALPGLLEKRNKRIVVEYTDFIEIMYASDVQETAQSALLYSSRSPSYPALVSSWETVFTQNDGIIYKESPELIACLSEKHQHRPLALEFHSYIVDSFQEDYDGGRPIDRKAIPSPSVVYIGSVNNDRSSPSYAHDASLLVLAKQLVGQGIYFAIFNGVDGGNGAGYDEYRQLAAENALFDYYPAVQHQELHRYLHKFDLAIQVLDYRGADYNPFFLKTTFATRLFNYLEAGLPVIISNELSHMVRIVQTYDIGISIDFDDVAHLGELIKQTDWERKKKNIAKLIPRISMDGHIPRLLAFYNHVCGEAIFKVPTKNINLDAPVW